MASDEDDRVIDACADCTLADARAGPAPPRHAGRRPASARDRAAVRHGRGCVRPVHHAHTRRPDRAEVRAAGDRGRPRTRQAHRRAADRGGGLGRMAHCHTPAVAALGIRDDAVVLVGNPNVGKSAVFNALTGAYVDVSNFPGTTVEITQGRLRGHRRRRHAGHLRRLLVQRGGDRRARRRPVRRPRSSTWSTPCTSSATSSSRCSSSTSGCRMVVALNMADEARREGVAIDRDLLEDLLGVPVIETVAVSGVGIDELKAALAKARPGHADPELDRPVGRDGGTRRDAARRRCSCSRATRSSRSGTASSRRDAGRDLHPPPCPRRRHRRTRRPRGDARRVVPREAVADG